MGREPEAGIKAEVWGCTLCRWLKARRAWNFAAECRGIAEAGLKKGCAAGAGRCALWLGREQGRAAGAGRYGMDVPPIWLIYPEAAHGIYAGKTSLRAPARRGEGLRRFFNFPRRFGSAAPPGPGGEFPGLGARSWAALAALRFWAEPLNYKRASTSMPFFGSSVCGCALRLMGGCGSPIARSLSVFQKPARLPLCPG